MFDPPPNWHEGLPPGPAEERLQREEVEYISEAERIGWGWSLLVSDREEEILRYARDVPGFSWSAVGLLDPEADPQLRDDDPRFGVILYADDSCGEGGARLENLGFEEIDLPVVVRSVRFELQHGMPTDIGPGRKACWATSRGGELQGWLTAKHVADHSALRGQVVDRGQFCIDAALVDVGPSAGQRIASVPPTANSAVKLDFGKPVAAQVLDIGTNCGIADSSHFPLRFTLNRYGQKGDSGGLVLAVPCEEPMGIYLGACELENGARAGFAQALNQLEYLMNLEAYL
jgi:hypothetical protein